MTGPISVTFTGIAEMQKKVAQLLKEFPMVVRQAARAEAERILVVAKARTPVDTGALRASGHVEPTQIAGTEIAITLGFGGPSAPYAMAVHENLEAYHSVGQAKFLESAMQEAEAGMAERIGAHITTVIGSD